MAGNLPEAPQVGDPVSKRGMVALLRSLKRAFEYMTVEGGTVQWLAGTPKIIFTGDVAGGGQLPEATTQYKVLAVNSSIEWEEDWVRWP